MSEEPGEYSVTVHPEPVGEWKAEETAIVQINRAMQALERASTIQEMVALRDKATALEVFVSAQGFRDAAQVAKVYQLQAERKAGAWLAENIDHEGGRPKRSQAGIVLADIDISSQESSRWQLEASLPAERFEEWVAECLAHQWELSAAGLRRFAEAHNGKKSAGSELPEIGQLKRMLAKWFPPGDENRRQAFELIAALSGLIVQQAARLEHVAGRVRE